jgi:PAS domain S-box-containing protein
MQEAAAARSMLLRTRLWAGFGLLLLLVLAEGLLALHTLGSVQREMEGIVEQTRGIAPLADARSALQRMRAQSLTHIITASPDSHRVLEAEVARLAERTRMHVRNYSKNSLDMERPLLIQFEGNLEAFIGTVENDLFPLSRSGEKRSAHAIAVGPMDRSFVRARDALSELIASSTQTAEAHYQEAKERYRDTLWTMIVMMTLSVLIAAAVAAHLTRSIMRPLERIKGYLAEVARGRTADIQVTRRDEFGDVLVALDRTQIDLARMRSEEAARMEELHTLGTAIESLPHVVKIMDPKWHVRTINAALGPVLGYSKEEVIGKHITMLRHESTPAVLQAEIERATEEGGWEGEAFDRHKTGNPVPMHITTVPVRNAAGVTSAILEIENDLTEQRDQQQRAKVSYRLAAIGELAAGVAHEVNNPLQAISSFAELVLADPSLSPDAHGDVQAIQTEAHRAGVIVRNLLAFARREVPEKRTIDVNRDVILPVARLKQQQFQLGNITLDLDLDYQLPLVLADPHQLQQVLHNLTTNARQAIQHVYGSGTIRITSRALGKSIAITVEDTGPGIDEGLMTQIFSPFFTTKDVGEGTGLGLSISYGIAQEHGGDLVASNWGRSVNKGGRPGEGGARFVITLPKSDEVIAPVPEEVAQPQSVSHATHRVLIVDDEAMLGSAVRKYLERRGYTVRLALRAEEAIAEIDKGENFDVILSDLKMPGMGGEGFYRNLVARRPDVARRIIFSSGDVVNEESHKFLEESGRPVLPKPYSLAELVGVIQQLVGSGPEAPAA